MRSTTVFENMSLFGKFFAAKTLTSKLPCKSKTLRESLPGWNGTIWEVFPCCDPSCGLGVGGEEFEGKE